MIYIAAYIAIGFCVGLLTAYRIKKGRIDSLYEADIPFMVASGLFFWPLFVIVLVYHAIVPLWVRFWSWVSCWRFSCEW